MESIRAIRNLAGKIQENNATTLEAIEKDKATGKKSRLQSASSNNIDELVDVEDLSSSDDDDPGSSWLLPPCSKPVPNALQQLKLSYQTSNLSDNEKLIREQAIIRLCLPAWSTTNSFALVQKEQTDYEERRRASRSPGRLLSNDTHPQQPSIKNDSNNNINNQNNPPSVPKNTSSISAISVLSNHSTSSQSTPSVAADLQQSTHTSKLNEISLSPNTSRRPGRNKKHSPLPSQVAATAQRTSLDRLSTPNRNNRSISPQNRTTTRRTASPLNNQRAASPLNQTGSPRNRTASPLNRTGSPAALNRTTSPQTSNLSTASLKLSGQQAQGSSSSNHKSSRLPGPRTKSSFGFKRK